MLTWRLPKETPKEVPITAFPGWYLLSPLAYGDQDAASLRHLIQLPSGEYFFHSHILRLRFAHGKAPERNIPKLTKTLLVRLRYLARQFDISPHVASFGERAITGEDTILKTQDVKGLQVRDYAIPTAITLENLQEVASLPANFIVPVHAEVMLDALNAHVDMDFRRSILYGAIAMEAFASERAQNEYEAALAGQPEKAPIRIGRYTVKEGKDTKEVKKDAVLQCLMQGDQFSRFLHEIPQYLLGRSLLLDAQSKYQAALRLYKTRNKIVHKGNAPEQDEFFPLTFKGSINALQAASDVLSWLGDAGPYCIWRTFVHAINGKSTGPLEIG